MRGKKKKLLEAGVIFYIRWGRPLSMPLLGSRGPNHDLHQRWRYEKP
jgi:hypothetical protein